MTRIHLFYQAHFRDFHSCHKIYTRECDISRSSSGKHIAVKSRWKQRLHVYDQKANPNHYMKALSTGLTISVVYPVFIFAYFHYNTIYCFINIYSTCTHILTCTISYVHILFGRVKNIAYWLLFIHLCFVGQK